MSPESSKSPGSGTGSPEDQAIGERILYVRANRDFEMGHPDRPFPTGDIYSARPDGTDENRLTTSGDNSFPAFSRDGGRIAFTSERTGGYQIFTMDSDGSNQVQVTQQAGGVLPSWSPDGKAILFTIAASSTHAIPSAYVIQTDGTGLKMLSVFAFASSFSPDGKQIVYMSQIPGEHHIGIFVMNADGSNVTQLTFSTELNSPDANAPAWSPDGTKIAFFCGYEAGATDISGNSQQVCVMDKNGRNRKQLTYCDDCASDNPAWSADGKQIIFDRGYRDTVRTIGITTYIINVDGTNEHQFLPFTYGGGRQPWKAGGASSGN